MKKKIQGKFSGTTDFYVLFRLSRPEDHFTEKNSIEKFLQISNQMTEIVSQMLLC